VDECLRHLAAALEVINLLPCLGDIYEIYFLESIQSMYGTEGFKMVCDIVELTATGNVCGVDW